MITTSRLSQTQSRPDLAGDAETRSIIEDNYELHFHKAVGSRVQLTAAFDGRIGIRIDYNPSHEHLIVACVSQLESEGFHGTGRHATTVAAVGGCCHD